MKPILPSLREKKRYLLYEVVSGEMFKKSEVENMINNKLLQFLGERDYAKAGIMFMNWGKNRGIIKLNNKHVDDVKAAMMLADNINNNRVIVKSVSVSGSLKKLLNKGG